MSSPRTELVFCLAALRLAVERWEDATGFSQMRSLGEESVRFGAIGEVLFWASALDEQLVASPGPATDEQLIAGMRYARNRMTHSLITTTSEQDGAVWPMRWPTRWVHYRWRPADEIPPPVSGPGKSDAKGPLTAYRAVWEDQLVSETMTSLVSHFTARLAITHA